MNDPIKPTFEEKVLTHLKEKGLSDIVTDEDMVALAKKAVQESLFQPRRVTKRYGGYDETDSPVVEAARKTAAELVEKASRVLATELLDDEAIRKELLSIVVKLLPSALVRAAHGLLTGITDKAQMDASQEVENLAQRIRESRV